MQQPPASRRASVPAVIAVLFGTVILAGCGSLDSNDKSTTKTDAARTTTSGTNTTGQTSTTGQTGGAGGTTTATGPGGGSTFATTAPGGGATTSSGGATAASTLTTARNARRTTRPASRSPEGAFFGGRFFSPTSPWNTIIETGAVDPRSQAMLDKANRRLAIVQAKVTSPGI